MHSAFFFRARRFEDAPARAVADGFFGAALAAAGFRRAGFCPRRLAGDGRGRVLEESTTA
jgi:hypothetical protein